MTESLEPEGTDHVEFIPTAGSRLGKLVIQERVDLQDPRILVAQTPPSYLKHGSMRRCVCDCGRECFLSEHVLKKRKHKSCGCIRLTQQRNSHEREGLKAKLADTKSLIGEYTVKYKRARIEGAPEESVYLDKLFDLHKQRKELESKVKANKAEAIKTREAREDSYAD